MNKKSRHETTIVMIDQQDYPREAGKNRGNEREREREEEVGGGSLCEREYKKE